MQKMKEPAAGRYIRENRLKMKFFRNIAVGGAVVIFLWEYLVEVVCYLLLYLFCFRECQCLLRKLLLVVIVLNSSCCSTGSLLLICVFIVVFFLSSYMVNLFVLSRICLK